MERTSLHQPPQQRVSKSGLITENLSLVELEAQSKRFEKIQNESMHSLNQLKKEQFNSTKLYENINEDMKKALKEASGMISRLEEEKRKHEYLNQLVKYYQKSIMDAKFQKYELVKRNQTEQLETCLKKQCQLDKELDSLVTRTNASCYQLSKKDDQVRTLRSERAIFSSVFDQIEKQMFHVQLEFKKVMIKKIALQKQSLRLEKELERVSIETEKQYNKFLKKLNMKPKNNEETQDQETQNQNSSDRLMNLTNKFKTHRGKHIKNSNIEKIKNFKTTRDPKIKKEKKRKLQITLHKANQKKMSVQLWQKKTKQIYKDLEVKSNQDIPNNEMIEKELSQLRNEADELYNAIAEKEKDIKQIKTIRSVKKVTNEQKYSKKLEDKQDQSLKILQQKEKQYANIQGEITEFTKNLSKLPLDMTFEASGMEALSQGMIQIDKQICQLFPNILSYSSNQKVYSDDSKLNQILNKNKTTKNTTKIYTEKELLQISKSNLNMINKEQTSKKNS